MRTVRVSSASAIKLDAVRSALLEAWPREAFEIVPCPTELQARDDFTVDAQPLGWDVTSIYVRARHDEMSKQHGPTTYIDASIESGAIDGLDVAIVFVTTGWGEEVLLNSEGIPFPEGTLEAARVRGFETTTAGDIIHEMNPDVPANNWQTHYPPYTSRQDQIHRVLVRALRALSLQ